MPLSKLYSKQRTRIQEDGVDIDASYITDNLIAMSFPASGIQTIVRNSINDVENYLNLKFHEKYYVFNLANEMEYDSKERFGGRVKYFPFENHSAPNFNYLVQIVDALDETLRQGYTCAVHCMAGKGRTGLVICCYLLKSKICLNSNDALQFFSFRRSSDGSAQVENPSQMRYLLYYERYLVKKGHFAENEDPLTAENKIFFRILRVQAKCVTIDQLTLQVGDRTVKFDKSNENEFELEPIYQIISGDVQLSCKQFRCKFNTFFMTMNVLSSCECGDGQFCITFDSTELDGKIKEGRLKVYLERIDDLAESARIKISRKKGEAEDGARRRGVL